VNIKEVSKSFLLVFSISCAAHADLIPGVPGQDVAHMDQYQPGYAGPEDGAVPGGDALPAGDQASLSPAQSPMLPPVASSPYEPNPYEPNPYEPNPYEPAPTNPYEPGYPQNPGYSNQDVKTVYVNRQIVNERLALRQLAGLGSAYRGWEVRSVRVLTRGAQYNRPIVQLVADGRIVASSQAVGGSQVLLIPNMRAVLDNPVRSLQLAVNGSLLIDQIQIEVVNTQNGYPNQPPVYGEQRVDLNISRALYSNDRVDLGQYINLGNYRGRVLRQVLITGRAQFNTSLMSLVVNGFNAGQVQFAGGYSQQQSIRLGGSSVIGYGADSLVLYSQGNMVVDRVTLVFAN